MRAHVSQGALGFVLFACAHREVKEAPIHPAEAPTDPIARTELSPTDLKEIGKRFGCTSIEGALTEISEGYARRKLLSLAPVRIHEIVTDLRKHSLPYVWPKVAIARGTSWGDLWEHLPSPKVHVPDRSDRSPDTRCGISVVSRNDGQESVLAALSAEIFAEVDEISERPRTGVFQTIRWSLRAPLPSLELFVLGPDGSSRRTLVSSTGEKAHAPFAAPRPGRYMLQLVGDLGSGPRPLSESWIFADISPSYPPDPPIVLDGADPRGALTDAVDLLRTAYGQRGLVREPSLEREATSHTAAMARAGKIAHDVGQGDARERFTRAGIERRSVGEVVAMGTSLDDAWASLLSSASHRATLVDPAFRCVGVSSLEDGSHRTWITINLASTE